MAKLKRMIVNFMLFLSAVSFCLPLVACGNESAGTEKSTETMSPCGLYTKLTFTVDSGNGKVWATAENKLTILPATVIVELELYNSETYKESYTEMSLADSNYCADLDQGKTLTVTASTNGKESYWKAKMRYKIDRDKWEEKVSETMLFGADGTRKEITSKPVEDDKEYYISDFLQPDAELVQLSIHPYAHKGSGGLYSMIGYLFLESEEEINEVKNLFGEIKLDPFDIDNKSFEERVSFIGSGGCSSYHMLLRLSDGCKVQIYFSDFDSDIDILGANLCVEYYREKENKFYKSFTATISDETKQALLDSANKIYESKFF